jgi:hypothetical protein
VAYNVGVAGTLWDFNIKINSARKGFNCKFHFVAADYATVVPKAVDIAGRLLNVLPTDAEIFFATISNNNTRKDSRFIRAALGPGAHVLGGSSPPASTYDMPQAQLLVRFEDSEGGQVPRKLGPVPDAYVSSEELTSAINDVVGVPTLPLAAIGSGADYFANFNLLMKSIVVHTAHVLTGHAPGGDFQWAPWLNAYVMRTCIKKGGRIFA